MNKARRKRYRRGTFKRLAQESLVLSSTRRFSSRFVRFFESGFASPLLTSAKKTDDFAREKITGPLYKKIGIRKNLSMPTRNAVASLISRSPVIKTVNEFRTAFLNTSMRSVGIFLLTFGIYAAAIFLLKSYVSLALGTEASVDDLSFAAVTALAGIILTAFGEKSILSSVGNGRIVGQLLLKCLGVNDSSVDRNVSSPKGTAAGVSFLLGSLFGITTLFFTPASVMYFILTLLTFIAIFHIPEFGLLLTAASFSFVSAEVLATIVSVTFASFLIKCIRLKRNFSFGTADAVVLLLFAVMFVSCVTSEGSVSSKELYVLTFTSVYFLSKNLLASEKLVYQTFNALCTGLSFGMALYILGDFASLIPHDDLRMGALWLARYTLTPDMLLMSVSAVLPFALASFSAVDARRPKKLFLLLTLACAVLVDSLVFYLLLLISVLVFAANAYKAPVGALLCAVVTIPPVAALAYDFTSSSLVGFGEKTVYDVSAQALIQKPFANFWSGFFTYGGVLAVLLFIAAVLLIFQRVYGSMSGNNGNRVSLFGGTAAASVMNLLICSFIFDPFSDFGIYALIWFVLGFCGFVNNPSFYGAVSKTEQEV